MSPVVLPTRLLAAETTPLTVDNFLSYADSGHYDGTIFHQVIDEYIVLGGGFTQDLKEKPTRTPIRNEAHKGLPNKRGTIAMARSPDAIDSATGQFFFNLADNELLDYKSHTVEEYGYCVFGHVVSGQDVLDQMAKLAVGNQGEMVSMPVTPVVIERIRRAK